MEKTQTRQGFWVAVKFIEMTNTGNVVAIVKNDELSVVLTRAHHKHDIQETQGIFVLFYLKVLVTFKLSNVPQ
jgi:hypothetical protein